MAKNQKKKPATAKEVLTKLWNNFVFRNIVVAASLLIIILVIVSVALNLGTRHNRYKDVPNFIGATLDEAGKLAKGDKLRIEINDSLYVPTFPPGTILEQRPAAGTKVKSKRRIFVTLNSYRQKMVDVPYVTGYSLRQAKNILETSGLGIEKLVYTEDIATNNILRQEVNGKEVTRGSNIQAEVGSGVTLIVGRSNPYEMAMIPRVVGLSLKEAQGRLWEAGLNTAQPTYSDDVTAENLRHARVWKQTPEQSGRAYLGETARLWLTTDSLTLANGMKASDAAGVVKAREQYVADSIENALRKHMEMMETPEGTQKESGDYERQEVPVEQIDLGTPSGSDEFFD